MGFINILHIQIKHTSFGAIGSYLYNNSLLIHALMRREGSRASLLIQERAEILVMELPSLTMRRLALVSFPAKNDMKQELSDPNWAAANLC